MSLPPSAEGVELKSRRHFIPTVGFIILLTALQMLHTGWRGLTLSFYSNCIRYVPHPPVIPTVDSRVPGSVRNQTHTT